MTQDVHMKLIRNCHGEHTRWIRDRLFSPAN